MPAAVLCLAQVETRGDRSTVIGKEGFRDLEAVRNLAEPGKRRLRNVLACWTALAPLKPPRQSRITNELASKPLNNSTAGNAMMGCF